MELQIENKFVRVSFLVCPSHRLLLNSKTETIELFRLKVEVQRFLISNGDLAQYLSSNICAAPE
jgi:hypothetical protein